MTRHILHWIAAAGLFAAIATGAIAQDAEPAKADSAKTDSTKADSTKAPQQKSSLKGQASEKYDTKLPIEISSDTLEVLQNENRAVFNGNVIAVQGKIRLNADTMIVHYKQKDKDTTKPAPVPQPSADGSADASTMGAITLIEVQGHVFAATPEEAAQGDKGHYQVSEKMLYLNGDNVILTRGKNILRGTDLVYNLETGRSVLTNKGAKVTGPNGGRVRGVFVPNEEEKGKGQKDKGKTGAESADKDKAKTEGTEKGKVKVVVPVDTSATDAPPAAAKP